MNSLIKEYKLHAIILVLFAVSFLSFLMTPDTLSKYTETFGKTLTINVSSNMASYTINATPSDSDIYLSVNGGTKTKVSSGAKIFVNKGSTVSYEISHYRYYDSTGSTTVSSATIENVSLTPDPRRQLTVKPNKPNQATQCVKLLPAPEGTPASQIVAGGYIYGDSLFYTSKYDIDNNDYAATTATVLIGDKIICSVATNGQCYKENNDCQPEVDYGPSEYYDYVSEVFTIGDDYTLNVELTDKPWITKTNTNNATSEVNETLTNYHPGYYLIQLWGADGGAGYSNNGGTKGAGGKVFGIVKLEYNDTITYSLGGRGIKGSTATLGITNIAGGASYKTADVNYITGGGYAAANDKFQKIGGSGGGYSIVKMSSTNEVLLLAGGGGGGSGPPSLISGASGGSGGSVLSKNNTINGSTPFTYEKDDNKYNGIVFNGGDAEAKTTRSSKNPDDYMAYGGTTTGGASKKAYQGEYLKGGNSKGRGGAGGGGLYGGGGGYSTDSETHYNVSGGGGGSSFVSSSVILDTIPNSIFNTIISTTNPSIANESNDNDHLSGGGIIIQYIGKKLPTS